MAFFAPTPRLLAGYHPSQLGKFYSKMVVDAKELRETTSRVMERYQIPSDRSEDLRAASAK